MEANQTPEVPGGTQPASPCTSEPVAQSSPTHDLKLLGITVAAGIAFNFCTSSVLHQFRDLSTNDVLGTVTVTLLLGIIPGMVTGFLTSFIQIWAFTPEIIYALNSEHAFKIVHGALLALFVGTLAKRGCFKTASRSLVAGFFVALVATIIQIGVLVGVGVFLSEYGLTMLSIITAYEAGGIGGQCLAAFLLLKLIPPNMKAKFGYTG